ncbi:phage holin, LLH family [Limosilactobacillus fermentum]|uniref:phage holin, LLH family n=1 Tax=Limosilactobacillus fermentum TaxID=1613 RepID=UPI0027B9E45B|nr:phage holin, LLH family [Limosilactobacillus fermentum]WLW45096.1 phage holin, LLH family [Limosilactobacillus fermentum]WLW45147.1 phage holin, LLH family [Limosilactobacillus fermentum]
MKTVNDIVEWLIQSGALTALFLFAWKFVKPWLDAKASHASAEKAKVAWSLLEQVADISVTALVSQDMTGKEKFDLAVKNVLQAMQNHGFIVNQAAVENAVQYAYEHSPLTPTVVPGNDSQPAQGSAVAIDPKEAK